MNATTVARNLTQDEIDAYYRQDFIDQVLAALSHRTVRFIVRKNFFSLVELSREGANTGQYNMSIAGEHRFTYRYGDFIHFIEQIYDTGAEIITLKGEVEFDVRHVTANQEATE